jgi:tungstate transport system ATP-binding protein
MIPNYKLTGIAKYYGENLALELDHLSLFPARIYVLTGANGAGKSTLLDILAFLSEPERGEVEFDGKKVEWRESELEALRKRVTLLHQSPYLFSGTVFTNVAYGLKYRGLKGDALKHRVTEALSLVRLSGFEERNVRQLSGGEKRRVGLARALALQPEVLLFDEPLANLDSLSSEVVDGIITSLPGKGTTVVVATHDPQHAARLHGETIHLVNNRLDRIPGEDCREPRESNEVQTCRPLPKPAL